MSMVRIKLSSRSGGFSLLTNSSEKGVTREGVAPALYADVDAVHFG
jgi:hypothetical protein